MAATINADNGVSSGSAGLKSSADSSGVLQLQTNGTAAVTVDTSQNVGIGTASPSDLLEVRKDQAATTRIRVTNKTSSSAATASILFENSTSNYASMGLWDSGAIGALTAYGLNIDGNGTGGTNISASNASGVLRFATGTSITERMRIDGSGNVGIGTSSPDIYSQGGKMFTVSNTASNSYAYTTLSGSGTGGGELDFGNQTVRHAAIASLNGSSLAFYTNSTNSGAAVTEKARLTASGSFLVGTTTQEPTAPFVGTAVAGLFRTIFASGGVNTGASSTLFTITVDTAYLVTVQTQNAGGLSTTAIVRYMTGGNPVATTTLYADNGAFAVTVSGTAVRITNNLGGVVAYAANIIRIF